MEPLHGFMWGVIGGFFAELVGWYELRKQARHVSFFPENYFTLWSFPIADCRLQIAELKNPKSEI